MATSLPAQRIRRHDTPRWHLRFVPPPYPDLDADGGESARHEPGSLAIIRVAEVDPAAPLLWLREAARQAGPCALLLEVMGIREGSGEAVLPPSLPPSLVAAFGDLSRRAGVRGVRLTTLGPADRTTVRRCLTSRTGLMEAARMWLRRARPDITRDIIDLAIRYIGEGAEDGDALGLLRISERTARRHLSSSSLPAPAQLRAIGRLLPPLLALQSNPSLTLRDVARPAFSYADAFKIALHRSLGMGAAKARHAWGVEAVLARTLSR